MKHYESVFIIKPNLGKDILDKVMGQVRESIEKNKGSVDEIKEWGKKRLAYPINKYKEGFYYLINFHVDPLAISKIKQSFNLNESIVRMLIVSV